MNQHKEQPSAGLDRLTATFSRDREYCDALAEMNGPEVARILIHVRWAMLYVPAIQVELDGLVRAHFEASHAKNAGFWTAMLLGASMKDLRLIGFFVVRGLVWEAGLVGRRALEHVGTLATLWRDPAKAAFLGAAEDEAFRKAFVWESDKKARSDLKTRGVQKRFASCVLGEGLSRSYALLSKYSVHGGSPEALAHAELNTTPYSCMFFNRPDPSAKDISNEITVIGHTAEMIAIEVATLLGETRTKYRLAPSLAGEGGFLMSRLVDTDSGEMQRLIDSTLQDLGWHCEKPPDFKFEPQQ